MYNSITVIGRPVNVKYFGPAHQDQESPKGIASFGIRCSQFVNGENKYYFLPIKVFGARSVEMIKKAVEKKWAVAIEGILEKEDFTMKDAPGKQLSRFVIAGQAKKFIFLEDYKEPAAKPIDLTNANDDIPF